MITEAPPFWLWRLDNIHRRTHEYLQRHLSVTTSGMYDPKAIAYVAERLGTEKVMFAVDFPYEDGEVAAGALAATRLDEPERSLIGHENAERLFRINA